MAHVHAVSASTLCTAICELLETFDVSAQCRLPWRLRIRRRGVPGATCGCTLLGRGALPVSERGMRVLGRLRWCRLQPLCRGLYAVRACHASFLNQHRTPGQDSTASMAYWAVGSLALITYSVDAEVLGECHMPYPVSSQQTA